MFAKDLALPFIKSSMRGDLSKTRGATPSPPRVVMRIPSVSRKNAWCCSTPPRRLRGAEGRAMKAGKHRAGVRPCRAAVTRLGGEFYGRPLGNRGLVRQTRGASGSIAGHPASTVRYSRAGGGGAPYVRPPRFRFPLSNIGGSIVVVNWPRATFPRVPPTPAIFLHLIASRTPGIRV